MRSEVQEMRDALEAIGALDGETAEALALLEGALDEIELHPEVGVVRSTFRETTENAAAASASKEGGIAEKRSQLKDHIDEWEKDYPAATLVIGRMASALASVGL